MKTKIIYLVIAAAVLVFSAQAGSIWARRDMKVKDMYSDNVARNIGDVLTIEIVEDSTIDNKAERTLDKTTQRDAQFNGGISIEHILPEVPSVTFGTGAEYSNSLDGQADYKDERSFVDYITVVVIDIMPNGNLVVAGVRERDIGGDIQTIEVSGIVRTEDISFNNIVESRRVANFRIVSELKGVSAPYVKPNWLGGFLDKIWLF